MEELSGNIPLSNSGGGQIIQQERQTLSLDEPVLTTIGREFRRVGTKIRYVLIPKTSDQRLAQLRDWDLWGPLFICLGLALFLSLTTENSKTDSTLVFTIVFVVVWIGAAIVTVNAQLLGGKLSFFQSVCLLGYSVFPVAVAGLIVIILSGLYGFLKVLIVGFGVAWSCYSSVGFLTQLVQSDRKLLVEYPVMLFFVFLGWFILIVQ